MQKLLFAAALSRIIILSVNYEEVNELKNAEVLVLPYFVLALD